MYGEGFSKTGELIDLGVKAGIIEKSGSWFSYGSERIGQGRENAKNYVKENKEVAHAIEEAIRKESGLINDEIQIDRIEDTLNLDEKNIHKNIKEEMGE